MPSKKKKAHASFWANVDCKAWWISIHDQVGGRQWFDVLDRFPFTFNLSSSSFPTYKRSLWGWSPSAFTPNPGTDLEFTPPRTGALAAIYPGPFWWTGSSSYYYMYGSSNFDFNIACATGGTLAFWNCPWTQTPSPDMVLYQGGSGATGNFIAFYPYSNKMYMSYYNGTYYQVSTTLTTANWSQLNWTHWAFTWAAGGYQKIYVNGQYIGSSSGTMPSTINNVNTTYLLTLGCLPATGGPTRFSRASIDDLAIWSFPMSDKQIQQMYIESMMSWRNRILTLDWESSRSLRSFPAALYNTY